ncbi:MAG: DUF4294 domain-containing protein [Bacteroidales bacterium]|nr:DUF4294 domain-containing protein [Bacteroidales bacterium]
MIWIGMLFCFIPHLSAQNNKEDNSGVTRVVIQGTDTIPMIELPEIRVYHRQDFEYLLLKRRYRRLIRNVKKAYPYSKIAGNGLKELDRHLATIENEKEKKAYIKQVEKEIMDQFEKEVKRLTITQGIILVKLIDRETGKTSYEVIKDLKGGITAFFWQGIARIFGNNLKAEYDPVNKDRIIEDIVKGIEAGFI